MIHVVYGMVWNMVYDPDAPPGNVPHISQQELWQRYEWFLREILPVADYARQGRIVRILHDAKYDGVLIPDHTPEMSCAAPWHAGMAFALGYMRACMQMVES